MEFQGLVFPQKDTCVAENLAIPDELGPSEVLIRNRLSLISAGTELAMFMQTHRGFTEPDFGYASYPFRPGYAVVGEVVAKGAGLPKLAVGTRVFPPQAPRHPRAAGIRRTAGSAGWRARPLGALPGNGPDRHVGGAPGAGILWRERARAWRRSGGQSLRAALQVSGRRPGCRRGSRRAPAGTGGCLWGGPVVRLK